MIAYPNPHSNLSAGLRPESLSLALLPACPPGRH
jgi:hypothetical protein